MKFQNPSLNSVLTGRTDGRTDERTSRNQYAPHFFKVGGIIKCLYLPTFRSQASIISEKSTVFTFSYRKA